MKKAFLVGLIGVFLIFPSYVLAKVGVGVGTGKIYVDETLHPGTIYKIPAITVINTGDEKANYEMVVSYRETQPELKPAQSWIGYSPKEFELDPEALQVVEVTINLPVKAEPGEYFAFLEAHPVKKSEEGNSSVSIAAASKLYFTVEPGNFVLGVYHKAISWWKLHSPWTNIVSAVVGGAVVISLIRRVVSIDVKLKGKEESEEEDIE